MSKALKDAAAQCGVVKFMSPDWREWHFESRRDPNVYHTVDLSLYETSGGCSCEHFTFRIAPLLRAKAIKPHATGSQCIHIQRANKILCVMIKRQMFKRQNTPQWH